MSVGSAVATGGDSPIDISAAFFDCHVHVGRFSQTSFSPERVVRDLAALGLGGWAISSTTTCDGDLETAEEDLVRALAAAPSRTRLLFWATPQDFAADAAPDRFGRLPYSGIKIHGFAHPWQQARPCLDRLFGFAAARGLPILVHTGHTPESHACVYEWLCHRHPAAVVVLAHGRPLDQAAAMARRFPSVLVDTAYLPLGDIRVLVDAGLGHKLIFGSDFPIDRHYYPRASPRRRYQRRLVALARCFGERALLRWAHANYHALFGSDRGCV